MRTIVAITCVLCFASSSRAEAPPAEVPPDPAPAASSPAPATAPEQPAPAASDPFMPPPPPPPAHSRVPEIVASIVTGGLVIASATSYWKWDEAQDRRRAAQWDPTVPVEEHNRNIEDSERWKKRTWLLLGTTFVSAAVTSFTWMRHQDPSTFSVQPTGDGDGAAVSYGGRF